MVQVSATAATGYQFSGFTGALGGTPNPQSLTMNGPASVAATFSVLTGPLTITTASPLPGGTVGTPYLQTLTAAGGTPPYNWSITGDSVPGLTLTPTGVLSGTPTTPTPTGTDHYTIIHHYGTGDRQRVSDSATKWGNVGQVL